MNATTVAWTITLFFGCSVAFRAINKLTEDESTGVAVAAQFGALAVIVGVVVLVVRYSSSTRR
jgi:uncharacterized membrane protein HdeD (DUF308 family)